MPGRGRAMAGLARRPAVAVWREHQGAARGWLRGGVAPGSASVPKPATDPFTTLDPASAPLAGLASQSVTRKCGTDMSVGIRGAVGPSGNGLPCGAIPLPDWFSVFRSSCVSKRPPKQRPPNCK
jgi:hypothetical protein